jgi:hypothetical protein
MGPEFAEDVGVGAGIRSLLSARNS